MTRTIEELKAIEQAATKGPWCATVRRTALADTGEYEDEVMVTGHGGTICWVNDHTDAEADATFITEARTAMPELIEEVESLRQQRDELLKRLKQSAKKLTDVVTFLDANGLTAEMTAVWDCQVFEGLA